LRKRLVLGHRALSLPLCAVLSLFASRPVGAVSSSATDEGGVGISVTDLLPMDSSQFNNVFEGLLRAYKDKVAAENITHVSDALAEKLKAGQLNDSAILGPEQGEILQLQAQWKKLEAMNAKGDQLRRLILVTLLQKARFYGDKFKDNEMSALEATEAKTRDLRRLHFLAAALEKSGASDKLADFLDRLNDPNASATDMAQFDKLLAHIGDVMDGKSLTSFDPETEQLLSQSFGLSQEQVVAFREAVHNDQTLLASVSAPSGEGSRAPASEGGSRALQSTSGLSDLTDALDASFREPETLDEPSPYSLEGQTLVTDMPVAQSGNFQAPVNPPAPSVTSVLPGGDVAPAPSTPAPVVANTGGGSVSEGGTSGHTGRSKPSKTPAPSNPKVAANKPSDAPMSPGQGGGDNAAAPKATAPKPAPTRAPASTPDPCSAGMYCPAPKLDSGVLTRGLATKNEPTYSAKNPPSSETVKKLEQEAEIDRANLAKAKDSKELAAKAYDSELAFLHAKAVARDSAQGRALDSAAPVGTACDQSSTEKPKLDAIESKITKGLEPSIVAKCNDPKNAGDIQCSGITAKYLCQQLLQTHSQAGNENWQSALSEVSFFQSGTQGDYCESGKEFLDTLGFSPSKWISDHKVSEAQLNECLGSPADGVVASHPALRRRFSINRLLLPDCQRILPAGAVKALKSVKAKIDLSLLNFLLKTKVSLSEDGKSCEVGKAPVSKCYDFKDDPAGLARNLIRGAFVQVMERNAQDNPEAVNSAIHAGKEPPQTAIKDFMDSLYTSYGAATKDEKATEAQNLLGTNSIVTNFMECRGPTQLGGQVWPMLKAYKKILQEKCMGSSGKGITDPQRKVTVRYSLFDTFAAVPGERPAASARSPEDTTTCARLNFRVIQLKQMVEYQCKSFCEGGSCRRDSNNEELQEVCAQISTTQDGSYILPEFSVGPGDKVHFGQ